jgi:hypothetical protein
VIWTGPADSLSSPRHSPDRPRSAKPLSRGAPSRACPKPSVSRTCRGQCRARLPGCHGLPNASSNDGRTAGHRHDRPASPVWCVSTRPAGHGSAPDRQRTTAPWWYSAVRGHAPRRSADARPCYAVAERKPDCSAQLMVVVATSRNPAALAPTVRHATPKLGRPVPAKRDRADTAVREPGSGPAAAVG